MGISERHITVETNRIQQALTSLDQWSNTWLIKANEKKTTYTIFSLSTKPQSPKLLLNNHILLPEKNPTYLGITFDQRMTWHAQIEKNKTRAKSRMAIMKKLAGTTWGADNSVLKKLYMGYVRLTLDYGISAWATVAQSNFNKINRVQNQAMRIITGGMRSTPIQEMEKTTGLQPMEDIRDSRTQKQTEKFKTVQEKFYRPYTRLDGSIIVS
uniref:Reverse transcriptase domain-containing protein n=2 Tax=Arion vulgaris TaxID=1028688 RepID=A0A0B7BQR2_9EUPU